MSRIDIGLCNIDAIDMTSTLAQIKAFSQSGHYHYVVTPNMDHAARLCNDSADGQLTHIYRAASLSLCDSRILEKLMKLRGISIPEVIAGSTLTEMLFDKAITNQDKLLVIGGDNSVIDIVRGKYPDFQLEHINPSMGFIHKPDEVTVLVNKIVEHKTDYLFLAVGSPQQERLAYEISKHNHAQGVALCIGASLLFLAGKEQRAPKWMQTCHLEWLYRMLQDPKRLLKRYGSNALAIPTIFNNVQKVTQVGLAQRNPTTSD